MNKGLSQKDFIQRGPIQVPCTYKSGSGPCTYKSIPKGPTRNGPIYKDPTQKSLLEKAQFKRSPILSVLCMFPGPDEIVDAPFAVCLCNVNLLREYRSVTQTRCKPKPKPAALTVTLTQPDVSELVTSFL